MLHLAGQAPFRFRPLSSNVSPHKLLEFRSLHPSDQDKLWHWLHVALWDPPPAGLRPIEVLQVPGVRIYAENWGLPSDVGVVAQVKGTDAGACWMRLLPVGVGLASVDAETPQLGIALEPEFQHKGYGRLLMREALKVAAQAGYRQVSLTVHPENPAQYMYESCGFRKVERRNNYHLMVASAA
jgi:GNAT superfamily N-acetyltransferase